jgi:hypothetical protein
MLYNISVCILCIIESRTRSLRRSFCKFNTGAAHVTIVTLSLKPNPYDRIAPDVQERFDACVFCFVFLSPFLFSARSSPEHLEPRLVQVTSHCKPKFHPGTSRASYHERIQFHVPSYHSSDRNTTYLRFDDGQDWESYAELWAIVLQGWSTAITSTSEGMFLWV